MSLLTFSILFPFPLSPSPFPLKQVPRDAVPLVGGEARHAAGRTGGDGEDREWTYHGRAAQGAGRGGGAGEMECQVLTLPTNPCVCDSSRTASAP